MSSIKIVQIAMASDSENGLYAEYLDDQGRIWYQSGHWKYADGNDSDQSRPADQTWVPEWKQLDLPEEPTV